MKDIAIFGAGGFGREIACLIKTINNVNHTWNLIGFFDDGLEKDSQEQYGPVLGGIDELNKWDKPISLIIAIGKPATVKEVVEKIDNTNVDFPNIISPEVFFMDIASVSMGHGNIICPFSLVSCNVKLGNFNLLNVYTQVGHDCEMGDYNIVMPSVNISGGLRIGNCNLFGVKSTVTQYKKIGNHVVIAPGAVMMRNGKDGKMYSGNPAKIFM